MIREFTCHGLLNISLSVSLAVLAGTAVSIQAADGSARTLTVKLGDYRYTPARLEVTAGTPVTLKLSNIDGVTPHNFTLKNADAGLDLDVNIMAGETKEIKFTPVTQGSYTFYCNKKLPFMKSHRDHGMEGTLVVNPPQ